MWISPPYRIYEINQNWKHKRSTSSNYRYAYNSKHQSIKLYAYLLHLETSDVLGLSKVNYFKLWLMTIHYHFRTRLGIWKLCEYLFQKCRKSLQFHKFKKKSTISLL